MDILVDWEDVNKLTKHQKDLLRQAHFFGVGDFGIIEHSRMPGWRRNYLNKLNEGDRVDENEGWDKDE